MNFGDPKSGGYEPGASFNEPALEQEKVEQKIEQVLAPYQEEVKDLEGGHTTATVAWEKIENKYGNVETSTYQGVSRGEKAVFILPGLGGGVDKHKKRAVKEFTEQGYDVVIVHRNGASFKNNPAAFDSSKRSELAAQKGEEHLGGEEEYGYKEWTKEFAAAASALADRYKQIQIVGESVGSLIALESLRMLKADGDPTLDKVDSFLSLAGQVGKFEKDERGRVWVDKSRKYALKPEEGSKQSFKEIIESSRSKGKVKMKNPDEMLKDLVEIVDRLYDTKTELPDIKFIHAMPWREKYFATQQGRALMERLGNKAAFIVDRSQKVTPSERHGMPLLKSKTLFNWINLDPEKLPQRVFTIENQAEDLQPLKWLGAEKSK